MNSVSYSKPDGRLIFHERNEVIQFLPEKIHSLLDIGCGNGLFFKNLKLNYPRYQNVRAIGIEPITRFKQEAESVFNEVVELPIEAAIPNLPENSFDCIVLLDVLEHLLDPKKTLIQLHNKATPQAQIIVSLPNFRYFHNLKHILFEKDWRYEDSGIRDHTHIKFFTEKSMLRLFHESGYEVVKYSGINSIKSWKFKIFNLLTFGFFADTAHIQFCFTLKIAGKIK